MLLSEVELSARECGSLSRMSPSFEQLVAEAETAPVGGWDFSWLEGRASEQRPSWGYQRMLRRRLASVPSALDIQTGGGEVLAGVGRFPPTMVATESWPENIALATARLHPLGVVVVADADAPPLPFGAGAFELVNSRHPSTVWWSEIARVLAPGGVYLAQHVGPASAFELVEFFLGPQPEARRHRDPAGEAADAAAAGLEIVELRTERLRMEFLDIAAVIYLLRKVVWLVPGFTVMRFRDQLLALHHQIRSEGPFVAYSSRTLIEARKPGRVPH